MPDKWEYPWYAAWDLASIALPLSIVDPDFAKEQLELMLVLCLPAPKRPDACLRVELQCVNPPVHAFATLLSTSNRPGPAPARRTSIS